MSAKMYRMSKADVTGQPQGLFPVSGAPYSLPATVEKILRGTFSLSTHKSICATRSSTTLKTVNTVIKKANSKVITKGGTTSSSLTEVPNDSHLQRLVSVKISVREGNIAYNFLLSKDGLKYLDDLPFMYNFRSLCLINSLRFSEV